MTRRWPGLADRRDFLRMLVGTATLSALPGFARAIETNKSRYPFSEVSPSQSGITWTHTAGRSKNKYLPEISGPGCAFVDYDNDGWMDIYLVNSGHADFYTPPTPLRNALYRNNRDGTFTNMTKAAGIDEPAAYGTIGAALGDYDKDGKLDILFNGLDPAPTRLYHNDGNWHSVADVYSGGTDHERNQHHRAKRG